MSENSKAIALLAIGILLMLSSLLADSLGFGSSPGVGMKQIIGAIVGVAMAVAGIRTLRRE